MQKASSGLFYGVGWEAIEIVAIWQYPRFDFKLYALKEIGSVIQDSHANSSQTGVHIKGKPFVGPKLEIKTGVHRTSPKIPHRTND